MDGTNVEDNTALYAGGGLLNDYGNSNATINDSSFTNNTTLYGAGGGIFNNYGASMTVTGGTLSGNVASDGGGIGNDGTILVQGSEITGNTGLYGGGGVYNSDGTVTITQSTLASNSAPGNAGGGLYSSYGTVTVTDSTFTSNSTGSYGGAAYISGGTATIGNSTLSNNSATASGGGLFISAYSTITIVNDFISENLGGGIDIQGYYTLVQSNTIINNTGDGVRIEGGSYNTVGTPDAGNTITGNTGAGVAVVGYAFDNSIRGNVINSNGGSAIDLGGDGRTVNDPGDVDSGPNYLLNYPVITGFSTGATTHVTGTLSSSPNPSTTFFIDAYADSGTAPVNPGESRRYLGSFQVTTDALGNASFDVTLAAATAPGEIVTATDTDMYGSTSEFSDLNFVKVTPTSGLYTTESGAKASFSVVLTSRPTAKVTIPLSSANTAEGTVKPASLTFTSKNWNVPQVVTVTGVDDSIADGPISYTIVTGPAISTDSLFSGMDGDDVQVTNFDNDFATLAAIQPAGSLVYDAVLEGVVASGGAESYSIQVDPGQKITVVVEPEGTDLKAKIQLFKGSGGDSLGTATAGAAGQDAVLQTIATQGQLGGNGPKTYEIKVSGASGTTGLYHVQIILNAAVENESHDGGGNDTRGTAQSLEPSFLPVNASVDDPPNGPYAGRGAVFGRTDASSPDYYAFALAKGESATLALTGLTIGDLTLALEDSSGTTLAVGRGGTTNLSQVINNFVATTKDTYYVRVTGSSSVGTDYSLVVTRNADFDTEANDSFATAQDLVGPEMDSRRWAMGAIVPTDSYVASTQTYAFEDISATGQAILQGSYPYGQQYLDPTALSGFQFTLFGSTSNSVYVSTNGYLYLAAGQGGYIDALNEQLAVFGAADAAIYWQVLGSGDQQRLVVQWNDVAPFDWYYGAADPITFEAVLSEADGSVQFNYKDLQTSLWYDNEGLNATVGISGYPNGRYTSLFLPTFDAPNQYVGTGRSTKILQPPGTDTYRITVDGNSTLAIETQTPASSGGEFTNTLDPIVRLYNSAGNLVASDDNGASDGLDAKLSYKVPKGQGGTYYIQVDASPATAVPTKGEYLLSVKKATGALSAFQVANTDVPDGTHFRYPPTSIQIDFNDVLLLTTVQSSDLKVDGLSATAFTVVDGDTVRFDLPGGLSDGTHTVTITAGAIQDVQGTKLAAFTEQFSTDTTSPRVVGSSIQQGDVLLPGDLTYTVTFSEAMNTANLDLYDFSLYGQFGGYLYPASYSFDAAGTTLTIHYSALQEDNYTLTLFSGDGQFEDLVGNNLDGEATAWPIPSNQSGDGVAGGNFAVSFSLDIGTFPFPTPLTPEPPSGSLVYDRSLSGVVNVAGDTDSYTIALAPGQTLTVFAYALANLQPTVEVRDHTGTVIGSAVGTGQTAIVQTVPITSADTYTITIGGAAGTAGQFALTAILNAAIETEPIGVPANNTVADAQNMDASFIDLFKGATRGVVMGASGDTDVYSFQLQAGQALSADLVFYDATPPQVFGPRTDLYEYTPVWVTLGDVNNDGKLDMVAGSYYGWYLTVRLGNGDGTFGAANPFGFGSSQPQEVALADLNGDGNLDAVSSNYNGGYSGSGGVTVMLGNGDGTFQSAIGYFAGYANVGLALGDVNGDGMPDIVTTSTNDSTVDVLVNNGDGTFGTVSSYAVGIDPNGVALGDFNGDGALDIVTSNFYDYSNGATVLLNNGGGTFGPGDPYFAGYYADKIAVGDLNGDGALDFALTNYYSNSVTVLMNKGDGTFALPAVYYVGGSYGTSSIALGDVNGDGKLDIVAGVAYDYSYNGFVATLLNNGDGTFSSSQSLSSGYDTNSVALGDLNGDGRPDLVAANLYGYSLSVFLNQSRPTTLELIAPDGLTVLASAEATDNVQAAFSNFIAPDTGILLPSRLRPNDRTVLHARGHARRGIRPGRQRHPGYGTAAGAC